MPDEHGSVTGQAGTACASVTCVVVTEQLRAYVVRASESLQHVPQQPCFPSHTSSQNHPLPPLSPFPFICMRSAIHTDWFAHLTAAMRTRVQGSARPCRSTLDCRSEASEPRAALRRSKSADARHRHSRRVHSHHGHRAAKPARPPAHLLVSEKTYTSRI